MRSDLSDELVTRICGYDRKLAGFSEVAPPYLSRLIAAPDSPPRYVRRGPFFVHCQKRPTFAGRFAVCPPFA
jgi:hypothetical protein